MTHTLSSQVSKLPFSFSLSLSLLLIQRSGTHRQEPQPNDRVPSGPHIFRRRLQRLREQAERPGNDARGLEEDRGGDGVVDEEGESDGALAGEILRGVSVS